MDVCSSKEALPKSTIRHVELRRPTTRTTWTELEDRTVVEMKKAGRSWEEISKELPSRTLGAIQVRYSTKLGGGTVSRKRSRA